MLGIMRKYKESIVIKIVFGLIVFTFVGTIFLVWGKGDKEMGPSGYAAKVNGKKISYEEYQRAYYRLRGIYEQIYGNSLTPEAEKQIGVKKIAIDSLVDNLLVRQEAGRMNIKVTKDEVANAIAAVPAFQKNGAFDFSLYQQVLQSNRMSPKDFEASQKEELMVNKARQTIRDQAKVDDNEALQAYKKQNDKINLLFAAIGPEEVKGEVKLTEQDLQSYLQSHGEEFKTQEQVSISWLLIEPAKLAAGVSASDDEIQTWYQKNIDKYQGKGGILPFAEVKDRAKADTIRFKTGQKAYEMAADAINKNKTAGIAAAAKAVGATVNETPLYTASQPAAALATETEVIKRSFLLKQGELGGPVETAKGVYILALKERKPAAVPALAEIKAQVEKRATVAKAIELAKKKAEETQAQITKNSGKLQETGAFGYNDKGDLPKIGKSPELMEAAFKLTAASPAPATPVKVGDRWLVFSLKQRIEAGSDQFQKDKEKIRQALLPKKQEEALDKWLKDLRAKAKIEINPALTAP